MQEQKAWFLLLRVIYNKYKINIISKSHEKSSEIFVNKGSGAMKSYLSVYSATTYEKVIERSRFIANCAHAESEEEANIRSPRTTVLHS